MITFSIQQIASTLNSFYSAHHSATSATLRENNSTEKSANRHYTIHGYINLFYGIADICRTFASKFRITYQVMSKGSEKMKLSRRLLTFVSNTADVRQQYCRPSSAILPTNVSR